MIETRGLTKTFGPRTALAGVDLSVDAREFVALVGPNGAGKTTLLRILANLARPTSGSVQIGGLDLAAPSEAARRQIGFLSHRTLLYNDLTAEQNLRFYAQMYDIDPASPRIRRVLERVGLGLRKGDLVQTFSRGMRQRLSVARAVLHEPQVLLLDEPYTGLDPQAVDMVRSLLTELTGAGSTVLLTTHRLGHALTAGQRILVLHHGRVVYDRPRDRVDAASFSATYRTLTQ